MKDSNYLKVKVVANSREESITRINEETYRIEVCEKAEANKANNRVRQILAREYEVDLGRIQIVTGHHQPNKIIIIK